MEEDKYDISQYTDGELYSILDLNHPTDRELEAKLIHMINKYSSMQNESGYRLANFFQNIYSHFFEEEEEEGYERENMLEGFENNPLSINKETIDSSKTQIAKQEVKTEPNNKTTLQSTFTLDYAKDTFGLNPLLKQTIRRIISIDSQYRDNKNNTLSTDFTFNLSETLKDVVSLKLTSVSIPITWYTVSKSYGSNFFYLKGNVEGINNGLHDYKIEIPPGNYNLTSNDNSNIMNAINNSIIDVSNLFTDTNFGNTSLVYKNSTSRSTLNIDIQKVYNESNFYLEFPYWTPSINPNLSGDALNLYRTQSIPSFLGFNKTTYTSCSIVSNQSYVLTSTINAITRSYTVDSSNNYFNIIQYDGLDDYTPSSTIYTNIQIPITNGTYYRQGLISEINSQLQNSIYLDRLSTIQQVDIVDPSMANVGFSHYEMFVKLNRYTVKQVPNSKIVVLFPDESTIDRNSIWSIYKSSTYSSALFFDSSINTPNIVYSESSSIKSSYQVNPGTNIYLKCISPPNYSSTNDFSMNDIVVKITEGNYIISDLMANINSSFQAVNTNSRNINPNKPNIFNSNTLVSEINNKFHLDVDITNTFTNSDYKISVNEKSVLDFMKISIPANYHLLDASNNSFNGSFNNTNGYFIDTSYVLTYTPYGNSGNKKDGPRKIYLPQRNEYTYPSYFELIADVEYAIRHHTVVDPCNNEPQSPLSNSSIIINTLSNGVVYVTLTIDIAYVLTENNYEIYFNDPGSSGPTDITNLWYNLNIDPSYSLYNHKIPQDPMGESSAYATILSNSNIDVNEITITSTNNKIKITPYYDSRGGAYSTKNNITLNVPDGQYTKFELIRKINELFDNDTRLTGSKVMTYVKNGSEYTKILMNVNIIYTSKDYILVFYDPVNFVKCFTGAKSVRNTSWDATLGWILGFRDYTEYELKKSNETTSETNTYYIDSTNGSYVYTDVYVKMSSSQIIKTSVVLTGDTATSLYIYNHFLIILNDYIQNHLNDGLVTITNRDTNVEVQNSNHSTITICDPVTGTTQISTDTNIDSSTQNEVYAMNQKKYSTKNKLKSYSLGPNIQDVFGIIPITSVSPGDQFVDSGGNLQNQDRMYFGPVNISRMSVKLINDKGDIVDLNNSNWSLSFLCEQLYRSENVKNK